MGECLYRIRGPPRRLAHQRLSGPPAQRNAASAAASWAHGQAMSVGCLWRGPRESRDRRRRGGVRQVCPSIVRLVKAMPISTTCHVGFGFARLFIMSWPLNAVPFLLPLLWLDLPFALVAGIVLPALVGLFVLEMLLRIRYPCPSCHRVFDTTVTKRGWSYYNVMRLSCIHCRYRIFSKSRDDMGSSDEFNRVHNT